MRDPNLIEGVLGSSGERLARKLFRLITQKRVPAPQAMSRLGIDRMSPDQRGEFDYHWNEIMRRYRR